MVQHSKQYASTICVLLFLTISVMDVFLKTTLIGAPPMTTNLMIKNAKTQDKEHTINV